MEEDLALSENNDKIREACCAWCVVLITRGGA